MKKATLASGSNNVFACKDGKTFLDKNNVDRLVREKGADMDYTNCSLKSEAKIEKKVVHGSQAEIKDISKGGKTNWPEFNKQ